jgi:hypothetical protein
MKIAKVGTTALSAPFRAASSRQINDLRKQKSCGTARIGEVRLAARAWAYCYGLDNALDVEYRHDSVVRAE